MKQFWAKSFVMGFIIACWSLLFNFFYRSARKEIFSIDDFIPIFIASFLSGFLSTTVFRLIDLEDSIDTTLQNLNIKDEQNI